VEYSDFTLAKAKDALGLVLDERQNLFRDVAGVEPSGLLRQPLEENLVLATAIGSEKARSEFLIAPILSEVRRQRNFQVGLFSGAEFNVDPTQGLVGFCDFILTAATEQYFISTPVITVVEAKNENIIGGLGQCAATMVAAQIFNSREGNDVQAIYGAVTSGTTWKFLILEQRVLRIDPTEYHISQVDKILAILLKPLQEVPT
jgi:hypothetical protein